MNPEFEKKPTEDTSGQLPVEPVIQARPEETYSEPETLEESQATISQAQSNSTQPSHTPPENQGLVQGLAITGIVLAFLQLQLIGLIFSIVAKVKATKGTSGNTLAIVGIVLNIVLGIITMGIVAAIVFTAYVGVNQRAQEAAIEAERKSDEQMSFGALQERVVEANGAANDMSKVGFAYYAINGDYATTAAELQTVTPLTIVSADPLEEKPVKPSTIEYAICDSGKVFRVGLWNFANNEITYRLYPEEYNVSSEPICTVVGQFINPNSLRAEDQRRAE